MEQKKNKKNIVFLIECDSQLKWVKSVLKYFNHEEYNIKIGIIAEDNKFLITFKSDLYKVEYILDYKLFLRKNEDIDILFLLLRGSLVRNISHIFKFKSKRPLLICSHVGIILRNIDIDLLNRCGVDILITNSKKAFNDMSYLSKKYHLKIKILITKIPFIETRKKKVNNIIKTILFAEQSDIPETLDERNYLCEKLIELADRQPKCKILIKIRRKKNEDNVHKTTYHLEDILKNKKIPKNLIITYSPIQELIKKTDLMITISSTAAIESIAYGVKTYIITDFGINTKYGTSYFKGSNIFSNLDNIFNSTNKNIPSEWLDENVCLKDNFNNIINVINKEKKHKKIFWNIFLSSIVLKLKKYKKKLEIIKKIKRYFYNLSISLFYILSKIIKIIFYKNNFLVDSLKNVDKIIKENKNKKRVYIFGSAPSLNILNKKEINILKKNNENLIIVLNLAFKKIKSSSIILWTDNEVIKEIYKDNELRNNQIIRISKPNKFNISLIEYSKIWEKEKDFRKIKLNGIYNLRNILTGALFLVYKIGIKEIYLNGIQLDRREYFQKHPTLEENDSYEMLDNVTLKYKFNGYNTNKAVKEIIRFMINQKFSIKYLGKSKFLKSINLKEISKSEFIK
ncbi:MAG: DUF6716 putative glycosyltransferase [Candidatus Woesearchaeota archaeon]